MIEIMEYIKSNYTWILIVSIIILLAIIGSYADKTNFGQGRKNQNEDDKNDNKLINDISNKKIGDLLNNYDNKNDSKLAVNNSNLEPKINNDIKKQTNNSSIDNIKKQTNNSSIDNIKNNDTVNILEEQNYQNTIDENTDSNFEESFNNFDREFDNIVPKKKVIEDDLLEDIEGLSFDNPEKKFSIDPIPDFDDVELPKIKEVPVKEQDIWKS